jgi:hypothetical protein
LRADRLDPADVLRDRRDGEAAAVRAWIDVTVPTRARLTFATRTGDRLGQRGGSPREPGAGGGEPRGTSLRSSDAGRSPLGLPSQGPTGSRYLVRDLDLSGRFDEVDRAALAEVLESSIDALIASERAGLTRAEAEAVLARREPPAVIAAPPLPPGPASLASTSAAAPSRWALGFFYAAQAQGAAPTIDHGPGLTLSWAATRKFADVHEAGRGPTLFASAQYRPPVHERDARIGVALYTVAARAGVECGPLAWSRLRVRLGAGADFVHVTPEASDPGAVLGAAHWSANFVGTAALRVNLVRPSRRFWLSAALSVDVLPTAVRYDATIDGTTSSVFSPWRLRPGMTLETTFF